VEDAALTLSVIAGHDPADPSTSRLLVPDYVAALSASVRGLRIGLFREYVAQADEEVQAAVRTAAGVLQDAGCSVEEVSLPIERYSLGTSFAVLGSEAFALHEPLLRRHAADYAPEVRRRLLAAAFMTAGDYLNGQRARRLIRDAVDAVLQRVDCLLAPTLPVAAPPITASEVRIGDRTEATRPAMTMFTRLFNLSGHPVVCLPCGFSRDGMPFSLQLVGRPFDEATILRLAKTYEDATEWHQRRPQVT